MFPDMNELTGFAAPAITHSAGAAGPAFNIIGVACSAADVEAPSQLVAALRADCDAAILLIQCGSRGQATLLNVALAARTNMPVVQAHASFALDSGHIYLIPPKTTATLSRGHVFLAPVAGGSPADDLLTSLAQELKSRAIGVVLSGGGSDGALGIRAIRQGGGRTFSQYPGSARYPGMPISAIETGCVDFVLRPNEIALELARLRQQSSVTWLPAA